MGIQQGKTGAGPPFGGFGLTVIKYNERREQWKVKKSFSKLLPSESMSRMRVSGVGARARVNLSFMIMASIQNCLSITSAATSVAAFYRSVRA